MRQCRDPLCSRRLLMSAAASACRCTTSSPASASPTVVRKVGGGHGRQASKSVSPNVLPHSNPGASWPRLFTMGTEATTDSAARHVYPPSVLLHDTCQYSVCLCKCDCASVPVTVACAELQRGHDGHLVSARVANIPHAAASLGRPPTMSVQSADGTTCAQVGVFTGGSHGGKPGPR